MKKGPSGEELASLLRAGHFGSGAPVIPALDPDKAGPIVDVPVMEITSYDRNPRRTENPKFEEIKESIREVGLQQPLTLTRRPGADRRMLRRGGNTRLRALQELFAETGDSQYGKLTCMWEPWTTETDVLVSHLIENDTRGDLTFVDKARAVRDATVLLEEEAGRKLSTREASERLRSKGFKASQSLLVQFNYCLNMIAPALPIALGEGLGKPQIVRIKQLEKAANVVWMRNNIGDPAAWSPFFQEALAKSDSDDWSFEDARRQVEHAMAERAGVDVNRIAVELGAELIGPAQDEDESSTSAESNPPLPAASETAPTPPNADLGWQSSQPPESVPPLPDSDDPLPITPPSLIPPIPTGKTPRAASSQPGTSPASPSAAQSQVAGLPDSPADARNDNAGVQENESSSPPRQWDLRAIVIELPESERLDFLRRTMFQKATDFAATCGMQHCIQPYGDGGGYLVPDLPAVDAIKEAHDLGGFHHSALSWCWWLLVSCSDQWLYPYLIRRLPETCMMYRVATQEDIADTLTKVGIIPVEAYQYAAHFIAYVSDETHDTAQALLSAYRQTRILATEFDLDFHPEVAG